MPKDFDRRTAGMIVQVIEVAMEVGWRQLRSAMLEVGMDPKEIVAACAALTELAKCEPLMTEDDFE